MMTYLDHSDYKRNMVTTRSQRIIDEERPETPAVKKPAQQSDSPGSSVVALSAGSLVTEEQKQAYGRGCRERKPARLFEEEFEPSRPARNSKGFRREDSSDDDRRPRRYPEREAAKRAVENMRMDSLLDEEDDEAPRRRPREALISRKFSKGSKGKTKVSKRAKSAADSSGDSSAIATSSEEESSQDDNSTDSSEGIVDDRDAAAAVSCIRKQVSLDKVVSKIVADTAHQGGGDSGRKRPRSSDTKASAGHSGIAEDGGNSAAASKESLGDITPLPIDSSITFASVGGMPQHIIALREMIMLPLLYPKLLSKLGVRPPRGVLFVGPPGTGKTLMARAVANESQIASQRKVSFFMRKGADILSKWVGESEKQLHLLFETARKHQPSIIFFDEIDGLAPVRHSKQEQSHAALVSTLLALLDGLDDRGQVVVIGATNRPDTLDPALRRPGRFDRELRFDVPGEAARRHIIAIHTEKMKFALKDGSGVSERSSVEEALLKCSEGWTGADIQACCTEATLHALRSKLPQIFVANKRLKIPVEQMEIGVTENDLHAAVLRLGPSLLRSKEAAGTVLPPLLDHMELLLQHGPVQEAVRTMEGHWDPAHTASVAARAVRTDDMRAAVLSLNAVSLPHITHGALCMLISQSGVDAAAPSYVSSARKSAPHSSPPKPAPESKASEVFARTEAMKFVTKHFSCFSTVHVALPRLMASGGVVGFKSAAKGTLAAYETGADTAGGSQQVSSVADVFASLRQTSPSVLFLHDVDEWLSHPCDDDDDVQGSLLQQLRYELTAALQCSDLLVILSVASDRVGDCENRLLGRRLVSMLHQLRALCPPCTVEVTPTDAALRSWVQYMWQCAQHAALMHQKRKAMMQESAWSDLPEDDSPLPVTSHVRRQERLHQVQLWHRVEYKRRQLRHLLAQWLSQFIANRKFQVLLNADLDLTEDSELWESWQKHIRGRRIGLQDVMEKLENEEYTCLSQYVADIEQICSNVRTFFTTRSIADQKYRHRAMELKETTVLNMYKIHKNVTAFCEEHKDMCEPLSSSSSSDEEGEESGDDYKDGGARKPVLVKRAEQPAAVKKKRPSGWLGNRRRKKKPVKRSSSAAVASPQVAAVKTTTSVDDATPVIDKSALLAAADASSSNQEEGINAGRSASKSMSQESVSHLSKHSSSLTATSTSTGSSTSTEKSSASRSSQSSKRSRSLSEPRRTESGAVVTNVQQQLFAPLSISSLEPPGNLNSLCDYVEWCLRSCHSLSLLGCHLLTCQLLRSLGDWRWEDTTAAPDEDPNRWQRRFATMWFEELMRIKIDLVSSSE